MIYRRLRISILWRILGIALLSWLGMVVWYHSSIYIAFSVIAGAWVLLVINLYYHISSYEKTIGRFFDAFHIEGESISYNKILNKHFPEIEDKIPSVIQAYNNLAARREQDYNLFNQTMLQAGIGIITFDYDGKIHFCNNAALLLLEREYFANISMLNQNNCGFSELLIELIPDKPVVYHFITTMNTIPLEIKSMDFIYNNQKLKLVTLLNVSSTVEQSETQAMERLIRFIQHEIMNSLSPIKLISGKLTEECSKIQDSGPGSIQDAIGIIHTGLQTINTRAERLTQFFDGYRKLADLPPPEYAEFSVKDMFNHIQEVLRSDFENNKIHVAVQVVPENLTLNADEGQIELVVINVLKNAIEALNQSKKPRIKMLAVHENNTLIIKITDNGAGIPDMIKESVFMPYYSTKDNGSGIGLAFSRLVLQNHNATIHFTSIPRERTEFVIKF